VGAPVAVRGGQGPRYSPRQQEVLDVVEAVFLRDGGRGVRIGELAAEASCSRSTLYELAPSREALLLLVLDRLLRRTMRRAAEAIDGAGDPVDRLRGMMTTGALDFAALGPQFLEAVREHPPSQRLFDRRLAEGRDVLERLIADAMEQGYFRHVESRVVAEAIIAIVMRFTDPQVSRSSNPTTAADLTEMVDVIIEGLRVH
jgi:AcrR family transcriptional regulator